MTTGSAMKAAATASSSLILARIACSVTATFLAVKSAVILRRTSASPASSKSLATTSLA